MQDLVESPKTKSVSRSVSMPENIWDAIENHAPTTPGKDRSGYIRSLVESDLNRVGALSTERIKLEAAVVEVGGPAAALKLLKRSRRR